MLSAVNAAHVAVEVKMMRSGFGGAILVVEAGADKRFFDRLIDDKCRVLCAHGRDNVVEALENLSSDGGCLGFIDADFDRVNGESAHSNHNVVSSDFHDVEMMMFMSPALDNLLREYGSENKIGKIGGVDEVRERVLAESAKLAKMRYLSLKNVWGLKFRGMDYKKFTDRRTLVVNCRSAAEYIVRFSSSPAVEPGALDHESSRVDLDCHLADLCCGHDVTSILGIGICYLLGSQASSVGCHESVERLLRLLYESCYFPLTDAFARIREWEASSGRVVLRPLPGE
ncbi:MAG: DUF4435 domain-containing protein [Myxococcales bacterium]|nr:DUF4435 domain-containing protein [Myxococcales bacterium]